MQRMAKNKGVSRGAALVASGLMKKTTGSKMLRSAWTIESARMVNLLSVGAPADDDGEAGRPSVLLLDIAIAC
jgi:hypothetical protein